MTRTVPFLRMILQLRQTFLTEALTFIGFFLEKSFVIETPV